MLDAEAAAEPISPGPSITHSNLYAKGLPLDVDEDQLMSVFGKHGHVQSVRIFRSNQVTAAAAADYHAYLPSVISN